MTEPFWQDDHLTLYGGDCREVLRELPAESVHCVVTSPPYWGLRDYGTATWDGGDAECDHRIGRTMGNANKGAVREVLDGDRSACSCGAHRIDSQLGLEATPEEFVANMVGVFREVRRVLRKDGTLWLNLGDAFTDKQLQGTPWRVAFALQADGWYLRSDVIWAKPNPMPESVTDRPTKAHEYLFLLTKAPRYYYDAEAVREPHLTWENVGGEMRHTTGGNRLPGLGTQHLNTDGPMTVAGANPAGRNLRSVWNIATEPYPGAHFATFPRKLVEPCVKAGTSERGVCPGCGAPWVREVERTPDQWGNGHEARADGRPDGAERRKPTGGASEWRSYQPPATTGWSPSCRHDAEPVPAVVLDPFAGSGTTLLVAQALGRRGIGIDLSPDYLKQALERNRQTPLGLVG